MAAVSRFRFLAIAMVFHLVYIYSIFDIYFVSPIVSGMQLFAPERPSGTKPPADRLVLFVGKRESMRPVRVCVRLSVCSSVHLSAARPPSLLRRHCAVIDQMCLRCPYPLP